MSSDVQKVTVLESEEDFGGTPTTISGGTLSPKKKKKKIKKQAAALKPIEKAMFKQARKAEEASKIYRERHSKSNKKKKNGWVKDIGKNYAKAMSKMMK